MKAKSSMMLWLRAAIFFFVCIGFSVKSVSSTVGSYSFHCSSIESVPSSESPTNEFSPFGQYQTGFYYSPGNKILNANISRYRNSFLFYTTSVIKTNNDKVFMIEASLEFQTPYQVKTIADGTLNTAIVTPPKTVIADIRNPFNLKLHGFWSESSGELCMIGTGSAYLKGGNLLTPAAVLKLHNVKNSSSISTLITGNLESLNPRSDNNFFEPISILMLQQLNYQFTLLSGEFVDEFPGETDAAKNFPLPGISFCSTLSGLNKLFHIQYTGCSYEKSCLPFAGMIKHLPGFLYLDIINCTDVPKRFRVSIKFQVDSHVRFFQPFNPNTTLIGEGMWDDSKKQLQVFLCRFLDITDTWSDSRIGDCTTRLSLRFPAIWTIQETSSIVGQIWTNKTVNDSGYFDRLLLRSTTKSVGAFYGLKYKYTEFDRVRNSCFGKKLVLNQKRRYPHPSFSDMKFDMVVKSSEGKAGWGSAVPLVIGNQINQWNQPLISLDNSMLSYTRPKKLKPQGQVNVSYDMKINLHSPQKFTGKVYVSNLSEEEMEISAEGIYDIDTGGLCMVGCRKFSSRNPVPENASMDCEILLNFQLPPVKYFENGGFIRGRIKSTRKKYESDYFEELDVFSAAYNTEQARYSIWKMDLEIAMVMISTTLSCLFVRFQLYHLKKHPETLPFISLAMLAILTLGQMIPLILNYEALFLQKHDQDTILFQAGGWVEVNEVIVRIVSMVAFLLQVQILHLAFSSRSNEGYPKSLWFAEKMTLLVTALLYAAAAFVQMLFHRGNYRHEVVLLPTRPVDYWQHSTWDDLKSFAGLVSDGFLLPQIVLNMFTNSRTNVLSPSFYIGTSLVRLLPHAYDLYSDHSFVQYKGTYIYVNPAADFFSTAWDIISPLAVLMFAVVVYLQQKFGGRCILPQRFRGLEIV